MTLVNDFMATMQSYNFCNCQPKDMYISLNITSPIAVSYMVAILQFESANGNNITHVNFNGWCTDNHVPTCTQLRIYVCTYVMISRSHDSLLTPFCEL